MHSRLRINDDLVTGFVIFLFHSAMRYVVYQQHKRARTPNACHISEALSATISCHLDLPLPRRSARPLRQDRIFSLLQDRHLLLVDAVKPVSETRANAAKDGVRPEHLPGERVCLLQAELPDAGRDACSFQMSVRTLPRFEDVQAYMEAVLVWRTEAGPEEDARDHLCVTRGRR